MKYQRECFYTQNGIVQVGINMGLEKECKVSHGYSFNTFAQTCLHFRIKGISPWWGESWAVGMLNSIKKVFKSNEINSILKSHDIMKLIQY